MSTNVKAATSAADKLQALTEKKEELERLFLKERSRISAAEKKAKEVQELVTALNRAKRAHGGTFADRDTARRTTRDTALLEQTKNRIVLAADRIDGDMRNLRQKINEYRLHRLSQDRVFTQMNRELEETKKLLVRDIETSNEIMEEKELMEKKRETLVAESDDSVLQFEAEYQALTQEIEEFHERQREELTLLGSTKASTAPSMSEEQHLKYKMRIAQLDDWIEEGHTFIEETDKRTRRIGDVFQLMMTRSDIDDLESLVQMFRDGEAHKFKIYSYIQHLNREIKVEDRSLLETQRQIADYHATHGQLNAEKREKMMAMREEHDRTNEAIKSFDKTSEANLVTVKEMVNVARRLANAVDAATVALEGDAAHGREEFARATDLSQLGDFVTEGAMTNCMGLVEERAYHAVRMFSDAITTSEGRSVVAKFQAQAASNAMMRSGSPAGRRPPTSGGGGSGYSEPDVSGETVSKILLEASKGPFTPKMTSPHGMTRLPSFTRAQVIDDDDAVPDERPMKRSELFMLARNDVETGSLTVQSSVTSLPPAGRRPVSTPVGKKGLGKPRPGPAVGRLR